MTGRCWSCAILPRPMMPIWCGAMVVSLCSRASGKNPSGGRRLVRPSPETGGQHIEFRRVGPACRRLDVAHDGEVALEVGEQLVLGAALEHLGDEDAAGSKDLAGEI